MGRLLPLSRPFRRLAVLTAIAAVLVGAFPPGHVAPRPAEAAGSWVMLGAYDPDSSLMRYRQFGLEAAYAAWEPNGAADFNQAVWSVQGHGRTPLITLDTSPMTYIPGFQDGMVLEDIAAGRYDRSLKFIADAARANGGTILLVWGPEMDQGLAHPWSMGRPDRYIAAWRHVVDVFRKANAWNVKFVWAPTGAKDSLDYYPGGDVVDAVGYSTMMADAWAGWGKGPRPLYEPMQAFYGRYWDLGKPFIVTGFAVAFDDPQAKTDYLVDLAGSLATYPRLCGFVYSNLSADPALPNFKLSADDAAAFVNAYTAANGNPSRCF